MKKIETKLSIKLDDSIMTKPSLDYEQIDLTQSSELEIIKDTKTVNYQVLFNNY